MGRVINLASLRMMIPAVVLILLAVQAQTSKVTNIARGGKVTQSSVGWNGVPKRAIDGNRESIYGKNSCTHTRHDKKPWWRLDLLKTYKINTVTITNRKDCCHKRINGAEIRIGNSLSDNGNANSRCTVISSIPPGGSKTFACKGMEGRYINVVIPGRKEYLTLCEVEVDGVLSVTNIARGGKVTQSSVGWNGVPKRAIDGNRESIYGKNSCSHTKHDKKPWWRLDLLKTYKINTVTITNRKDCCHGRLNGAEIRIGNSLSDNGNSNSRCTVISSIPPGGSKTFACKGMEGRYINVVIPGRKEYLTLCEVEVDGVLSGTIMKTVTNIARGGKVTQSSVGWNGVPKRAIDGNRESIYGKNSCTHTRHDKKPWWRLDLLKIYKINTVTITNRKDCCHGRLNGAEIRIGNSLSDNGNANSRCTVISSIPPGGSKTFACKGMEGRYINVVIPGRKEYLTLCEVEVDGVLSGTIMKTVTNIARGGKVTQSSVRANLGPQRAIDGNRESNARKNSCTHTNYDKNPWWRLDLLKTYKINTVTITNRKDCCHRRLNGAEIRIGNSLSDNGNANSRCTVISSIPPGGSKTFACKGMEGRYINVVIPGRKEYLTLCEVEVDGVLSATIMKTVTNIARGGKVTQSSVGWNGVPGRAIDGNRESIYGKNSCSHTKHDKKPWWRLDLLKTYKINTVTITNRKDCCHGRLNGAELRIGNSLMDNGNANPRCTVISSLAAGSSKTVVCKGMIGRYVNIVIPGRKEYLTLCEVEVDGEQSNEFVEYVCE